MSAAATSATAPLPLAGLARRFASLVYELLLLTAVVFVAGFLLLPLISPGSAADAKELTIPALPQRVALFCLLFAILAAFYVGYWSNGRRTLPMKTWRLSLVLAGGAPVPPKVALLRYLAAWIGPLLALAAYALLVRYGLGAHATWLVAFGFLWAFVDRDRQFLHDRIAGTRVVH
ncbi:MAG: RDD family protein [Burkholderiales bacterium]